MPNKSIDREREEWIERIKELRRLRFVAALVILLGFSVLRLTNFFVFPFAFFCIFPLSEAFINQPYDFIVRRVKRLDILICFNLIFDVFLVTWGIHFLGGMDLLFATPTYCLTILYAGISISSIAAYYFALMSLFAYGGLTVLEFFRIIPHIPTFNLGLSGYLRIVIFVVTGVLFYLVAFFSSFLAKTLKKKNEDLDAAMAKLEEEKRVLAEANANAAILMANLKEKNLALAEAQRRFEDVGASTRDWIWEMDTEGRYTYASPMVENILGYKPEEIIGKYFYDFFHPDDKETLKREVFDIISQRRKFIRFLNRNITKNGITVIMETNGLPILNSDGVLLGYRGADRDVTEYKKSEEALRRAFHKLKDTQLQLIQAEKFRAVGQLASGVAHEVKNPLAIITQAINYLEDTLKENKDASEVLQMVKTSIRRADDIIKGLVDFARETKINIKAEDINTVIEKVINLMRHNTEAAGVKIFKELEDNLPNALIDAGRMEQVFINIFLNAIQAMNQGGEIFVRTYIMQFTKPMAGVGRRATDFFKTGEKAVAIEIRDTGPGIPIEYINKVFDPFFTTKGPKKGSGLGLSVVKNILELHRGLIRIESKVAEGTKVIIALKIAED
jgi:PAS domain S-box-containing protein